MYVTWIIFISLINNVSLPHGSIDYLTRIKFEIIQRKLIWSKQISLDWLGENIEDGLTTFSNLEMNKPYSLAK